MDNGRESAAGLARGFVAIVVAVILSLMPSSAAPRPVRRDRDWTLLAAHWPSILDDIRASIAHEANGKTTLDLYYLELWTYDVFQAATVEGQTGVRDDLLQLYESRLNDLQVVSTYKYLYDPRSQNQRESVHELPARAMLWLDRDGGEVVLSSSQFIFLVASAVNRLLRSDPFDDRARDFVTKAVPVVRDHLLRWVRDDAVFQVAGWGCGQGLYNHRDFLRKKYLRQFGRSRPLSYCNMVQDIDLWIIGATAQLVASQQRLPEERRLPQSDVSFFKDYLAEASRLLEERSLPKTFRSPDGREVRGLVFEAGAFDDHEGSRYSGYSGADCPKIENQSSSGVGWDTSHGARQPVVFTALFETRAQTGMTWPDEAALAGFGRAFAYGVFDGDYGYPRLRNFLDGANGWYQVDPQTCTGYPPFGMSQALLYGAWGRYAPYEPQVARIVDAAFRTATSDEPAQVAFRAAAWDKPHVRHGRGEPLGLVRPGLSMWMLPILATHAIAVE